MAAHRHTAPGTPPDLSDMNDSNWVSRWLPPSWQPYARLCRLDRPIGTWLTLLPTLSAVVLAAGGWPDLFRLAVFTLGALLMRGVGCTLNDIFDRNFDGHVERTRQRPLASGQITLRQALVFLVAQLVLCALLLFAINTLAIILAIALLPLVVLYPLCKRFTYWPQVVLGMAFNWGMLMAWADTTNTVPPAAWALWVGAVLWQVGYDTIYAYVDRRDDAKLGLHSTALRFGDTGKTWISAFYIASVLLWGAAGAFSGVNWPFYAILAVIAAHLVWQMTVFDVHKPDRNFMLFLSNLWPAGLLVAAALAGTV